MRSTFIGFYSSASEHLRDIWLSEATLFVFDTNCLLNLYRCEDHTREDILSVMREIKSRTWIPFQVGFEYQRNRRGVIEESINSLVKIKNELQNIYTKNLLSTGGIKKYLYNNLNDEISELQQSLKTPIDDYINSKIDQRIADKKSISEHDFIRDSIDDIILDKVGPIPTQQEIEAINKEGDIRYAKKQPPGFRDDGKKTVSYFSDIELQDKFGDLYLWMQIIEKAKSEEIKNVIFVCDDNKPDWWFIHSGKTHGALEALKTEICNIAKIDNFKIINQLTFLHEAKNHLANINVSESSLKEIEKLSSKPLPLDESSPDQDIEYDWESYFKIPDVLLTSQKKNISNDTENKSKYIHEKDNGYVYGMDRLIDNYTKFLEDSEYILEGLIQNRNEILEKIETVTYLDLIDDLRSNISRFGFLLDHARFRLFNLENKLKLSINTANLLFKRIKKYQADLEKSVKNAERVLNLIG